MLTNATDEILLTSTEHEAIFFSVALCVCVTSREKFLLFTSKGMAYYAFTSKFCFTSRSK